MLSRLISRLSVLVAISILAGITYYFLHELRSVRERERLIANIRQTGENEGPCAGLASIRRAKGLPEESRRDLENVRRNFAKDIAGDPESTKVLLNADRDGVLDELLCQQIAVAQDLEVVHPVFELLRYLKFPGRVCDDEKHLSEIVDGLDSDKPRMLRAILREVQSLQCLSPELSEKIASLATESLFEAPRYLDDLDTVRIAGFLAEWSPVTAAQFGCYTDARSDTSKLGVALGCTPDQKNRILTRYTTRRVFAHSSEALTLPANSEVVLLREDGPMCVVAPLNGTWGLYQGGCSDMSLLSDLHVAVRIESLIYGRASADLVAGLVSYLGAKGQASITPKEPDLRSWYGYNRDGHLLGPAHVVELQAVAAMLGENVPDRPLRAFCKRAGARYCYDVDWAHAVSHLPGEAVIFLSRPNDALFLRSLDGDLAENASRFRGAFGRAPDPLKFWRMYATGSGGELAIEASADAVEIRWRLGNTTDWTAQVFGGLEGGKNPPSARLLAALDVERDSRPEIVIQRVTRELTAQGLRDDTEEMVLLRLDSTGKKFTPFHQLTVHEY